MVGFDVSGCSHLVSPFYLLPVRLVGNSGSRGARGGGDRGGLRATAVGLRGDATGAVRVYGVSEEMRWRGRERSRRCASVLDLLLLLRLVVVFVCCCCCSGVGGGVVWCSKRVLPRLPPSKSRSSLPQGCGALVFFRTRSSRTRALGWITNWHYPNRTDEQPKGSWTRTGCTYRGYFG